MMRPVMPAKPCIGAALSGSSILSLRKTMHMSSNTMSAQTPSMMAAQGSSTWQPAVTATKPHRTPLQTASRSHACGETSAEEREKVRGVGAE